MPKLVFGHCFPKKTEFLAGIFVVNNTHFCNLQVKMWVLKDLGGQIEIAFRPSVVDESIISNPNILNFNKENK